MQQTRHRGGCSSAFAAYGHLITRDEVRARLLGVLEARVLGRHNAELRGYFETLIAQLASPFAGVGEDDAISSASDEDLEQTALLFMHYDTDGDGLLTRDEFAALVDMVASSTAQNYTVEHIDRCFA